MNRDPNSDLTYDEAYYTTFPDGTVLCLYWTWRKARAPGMQISETVRVHRSLSGDDGRTWSQPEPTDIVGQISAPLALDDHTLLVASNYRYEGAGIRMWLSDDRGETFDAGQTIQMWDASRERIVAELAPPPAEPDDQSEANAHTAFAYGMPELNDLGDGTLLLTYWATVDEVVQTRACRFRLG